MKSNPVLEEIWENRRELDRLAAGDPEVHAAQTNAWAAKHLPGRLIDPKELPAYFAKIDAEKLEAERAALELAR